MSYSHDNLDPKWQEFWIKNKSFEAEFPSKKPKFYVLDMFPYPSASGLHVGHIASYTPSDVVARYKRSKGFNVLHPMGWDAFGLPAEQYAIKHGVHPAETTQKAIENYERQLASFGFSFDWERSVSTADPKFYKWTQFIFTKLFESGLAYQKEVPVNWCPTLKTVLANEEIKDGKSTRGDHEVIQLPMKQWMLKITDYSEKLLSGLENLDWPHRTQEGQKNWIGKSVGANIYFKVENQDSKISVFTTRPDTLFGVTYLCLAPENPLVSKITSEDQKGEVHNYIKATQKKSDLDRKSSTDKTGVFTGAYALHPYLKTQIPIWISDYVLMNYGTGAVMAVPAHDERDFEFANKFSLPIKKVVETQGELPDLSSGVCINSDFLNNLPTDEAKAKIIEELTKDSLGEAKVQYKLRDWLFSRQRYWGEPIPIIHQGNESQALPLKDLPLTLPEVTDYEPDDTGAAPLARNKEWIQTPDGQRESHTMPGSAGSSWYFLRYTDPHNENELASMEAQNYWMPVDLYCGGAEHTVGHLLYSRFWQNFLFDNKLASTPEPYQKLAHQGMILGSDGEKMSKSKGNGVNPDEVRVKYGADAVRIYSCFMGPYDKDKIWETNGLEGVRRFLERIWRLILDEDHSLKKLSAQASETIIKSTHKTIKKVSQDIESLSLNTAISQMMIFVNELYKEAEVSKESAQVLVQLLAPFAPHLSEELWALMGFKTSVMLEPWPEFKEELCRDEEVTLGVQVNGKMRGTIKLSPEADESEAVAMAKALPSVEQQIDDKNIVKVIYKAGKILNLIAK